jgi:hypothetical protein
LPGGPNLSDLPIIPVRSHEYPALSPPRGGERQSEFAFSVPPMDSADYRFSAAQDGIQGVNMICRFTLSGAN